MNDDMLRRRGRRGRPARRVRHRPRPERRERRHGGPHRRPAHPPRVLPRRRGAGRARGAARRRLGVPRPALPLRDGERARRALGHDAASRSTRPATARSSRPRSTVCGKLRAAGIRILAGGDFGHQWTHHGTYAAELQRYVELVDMTPVEAIHTATRNMGAARRPRRRRGPRGLPRRPPRRRRRPDRRHHGAAAARAPPGRHQGRRVRLREPRGLPVTDVHERDPDGGRSSPGSTRWCACSSLRQQLDERRRPDDRDDGLGVPGVAAGRLRPQRWSAWRRARRPPDRAPPGPQRGARGGDGLGQPDGRRGRLRGRRRRRRRLVRQGPGPRPLRRRAEARQRHGRRARTAASSCSAATTRRPSRPR